jgi:two-component system response regulator DevR
MQREFEPIRVVIAEDNVDLSAAVCALLESEPDITVVGTTDRADALLDTVRHGQARVVVLDLNLAGRSSVPAMETMRRELPGVAVVIYSGYDRHDVAGALPMVGAVEFVSKSGDVADLLQAVRRVAAVQA